MGIQDSFDNDQDIPQSNKKQWDEDLVQSLMVQQGVEPVIVEACLQMNGTRLWGIFSFPHVMSKKDGLWYFDPSPCDRPDNYQELFRWDSAQEAFDFATKMLERNDAIAKQNLSQEGKND